MLIAGVAVAVVGVLVLAAGEAGVFRATGERSRAGTVGSGAPSAAYARPPQLVQAGDSKTSCIYVGLGTPLERVVQATGINYNCLETFSVYDSNWATWASPWVTGAAYGYKEWLAADPTGRTIILTQDLVPEDVATLPDWRALGAAGRYDKYARQLAVNLVRAGFGSSVIRLGAEMNGPWEIDYVGNTLTQRRQWAEYFARIVAAMRAVHGAHFLFDWNPNAGYEPIPLAEYYPGNAYVDLVGADAYDESSIALPPVGSRARPAALASEPAGLDEIEAFAERHHKPMSLPEWATVQRNGDDGAYVDSIGKFVLSHDVAFQCWFDAGDQGILTLSASQAPLSLAAYVSYFGPHSPVGRYERAFIRHG